MVERGRAPGRVQGIAGTWPLRGTVHTGGFAAGFNPWTRALDRLREWVRAEVAGWRLLPWVPIAFGTGIAFYFAADREPVLPVVVVTAIGLGVAAFLLRRHKFFPVAVMIASVAAGFATATWKTAHISHEVLARPAYSVSLSGFVEARDIRERTDRFVLRVTQMDAPRLPTRLERVRLSVRKGTAPDVGSFVELKARLQPPLAPLRPGSYDFGRDLFFQGIGASGFVTGSIKSREPPVAGGLSLRYAAFMQDLRDAVDARIHTTLDGDKRAIATALLTGRRDAITTPVNDAMFISGLGHVLSISGYHMAVVAGVVFFVIRALLALVPVLTVAFPIKKWAAAVALAAAAFYLLLSGNDVATQRSFYMTAIVLIAVMADRRAVTFRTLALAAMAVLILVPEALVHPSFQMSFAATLGLVALVQIGMPRLFATPENSAVAKVALWGGRELMTLALASLVAGFATTPYAAFHFHRVTPYGLLANLAAMPVVSAVVMPAGMLGLLAMPFGFDGFFWWLMGVGIDWMIVVTEWVAALPGAIGRVTAFGVGPLIVSTLGIVLLGLLRTPLRWTGGALLLMSVVWAFALPQPDVLISGDGHNVAVRGRDGRLRLMKTAKDAFLVKEWLASDADSRDASDTSLSGGVSCDDEGCVAQMADGRFVALSSKPDGLADDCARAALIVTAIPAPPGCEATTVELKRLRAQGVTTLRWTPRGFVIDAVKPRGTNRPWSPSAGDIETQAEPAARATSARPVDATPAEPDLQSED